MYDELIRSLRCCADNPCFDCKFRGIYMDSCDGTLKTEAANAIELQQKLLDGLEADNDSLCATIAELERDLKRSKEYEAFWEKEANEALKKFQTTVTNKPRWIPVSERLPEEYVNALCHLRSLDRQSEYYSIDHLMEDGQWWKAANSWKHEVTHWMPLPPPPKEE